MNNIEPNSAFITFESKEEWNKLEKGSFDLSKAIQTLLCITLCLTVYKQCKDCAGN
jgi:hypothetical protein